MPEDPTENVVRNLFALRQLENELAIEADRLLRDLFDDIAAQLGRIDPTGPSSSSLRQERLDRLMAEVRELTGSTVDEIRVLIADGGTEIGLAQSEWAARQLRDAVGRSVLSRIDVDVTGRVGRNRIRAILTEEPFRGAVLSDWTDRQANSVVFQVRRQVQLGMAQDEPLGDIVRRVRGRQAGFLRFDPETGDFVSRGTPGAVVRPRFRGGVLSTTTRQTEALVRTAINHVATRGHQETYRQNRDVTKTYTYTAVLDSRTTEICMSLDGRTFDHADESAPRPPMHFNCRSIITPNVDWEGLGIEPPEEGTRASADGQVPSSTTYEDWLRDQSAEVQDDILGPGRAKLFRANKINLRQLVTRDRRRRTLSELRQAAA